RWVGTLPARLDYNVEMVAQRGSLATDDISAWAGHWMVRETLTKKYAVKAFGEFNYASGDGNATDGTRGTFDQLYPTPHDKIGLADQASWKNVKHLRAGFELTPRKGLSVATSYHSIWLANTRDALYNAGGAVIARVPAGAASAHVGQEIDVQATWAVSPILSLAGGYSHLAPGAFLKQATPGASYSSPYLMLTYLLFADK
ncbi:MAG: alginate export family protein, partial [Vicinamibacterales bacterium]